MDYTDKERADSAEAVLKGYYSNDDVQAHFAKFDPPEDPDKALKLAWRDVYNKIVPQDVGDFYNLWMNNPNYIKQVFKDLLDNQKVLNFVRVEVIGKVIEQFDGDSNDTVVIGDLIPFLEELRTKYTEGSV